LKKLQKQTLFHQQTFVSSETFKQESFKVVWKSKRAWFLTEEEERGLQSNILVTLGRIYGTLKGCLLGEFHIFFSE